MSKKILIYFFLFFLLINVIPIAFSKTVTIQDHAVSYFVDTEGSAGRRLMVDTNYKYHYIFTNKTNFVHATSTDKGSTWSFYDIFDNAGTGTPRYYDAWIDSNNNIHVIYSNQTGVSIQYIKYDGNTWGNVKLLSSTGNYEHVAITGDIDDTVHCFFTDSTPSGKLMHIQYFSMWDTWSSLNEAISVGFNKFVVDTDIYNDIHLVGIRGVGGGEFDLCYYKYDYSAESWSSETRIDDSGEVGLNALSSLTMGCDGSDIYVVYGAKQSGLSEEIRFVKSNNYGVSWSTPEQIFYQSGKTPRYPSLSIDYNGNVYALWRSNTNLSPTYQIVGKTYSWDSWSDLNYYTTNSTNKNYVMLCYQNYPLHQRLVDGFIGVHSYDTNDKIAYFDEGSLVFFTGDSADTIIPACDNQTIGRLGDSDSTITGGAGYNYLWTRHNLYEVLNIERIDLQVHNDMLEAGVPANHYKLKVNQYYLGGADSWTYIGSNKAVLSWTGLNLDIEGQINFLFKAETPYLVTTVDKVKYAWALWVLIQEQYEADYYQYWSFDVTKDDINNDNLHDIRLERTPTYDWFWNIFSDPNYYSSFPSATYENKNYDLLLRLCVSRNETGEVPDYPNTINVQPTRVKKYESVDVSYLVNRTALGYDKYVSIIPPTQPVFKYNIVAPSGHFFYTPTEQGDYYVNLTINHKNITYTSFNVSGELTTYLYTNPNPSEMGQVFNIYYAYPYTEQNGRIKILDSENKLVHYFTVPKNSNSSEYPMVFQLDESGVYTIRLCGQLENYTYYEDITYYSYKHVVGVEAINTIYVSKRTPFLDSEIRIWGEHSHVGGNIVVRVGLKRAGFVGDNSPYALDFVCRELGHLKVSLNLKLDTDEIELAYTYIDVGERPVTPSEEMITNAIDEYFTEEQQFLLGIVIICVCVFIPLYINYKWFSKQSNMKNFFDIPAFVYITLVSAGLGIDIYLGLFELWIIVLFLVAIFFGIAYLVVYGRQRTGGD